MQPDPVRGYPTGAVVAADHLAAEAGAHVLRSGGSAADAAVAASAAMAVTSQHLCGMGGDLFAVVATPDGGVHALDAAGWTGSGADADALRREGFVRVPADDRIEATPVPGCVDGWVALHRRFGRLPLADVLAPARRLAALGFPCSPTLAASAPRVAGRAWASWLPAGVRAGQRVVREGAASALDAIGGDGRDGFYGGAFGEGLLRLGAGLFDPSDLAAEQARWVEPLAVDAWGARVWTCPPTSSGYLALAGARVAGGLGLPVDPADPAWAHLLVEASRVVGFDRPDVLFEGADGAALLGDDRLDARRRLVDPDRACDLPLPTAPGGTTYLCAVDGDRLGVSLIQSNARGFGSGLGEPATGIGLQNRAQGFTLEAGHRAEYGPRRRPPHTLAPVLVTAPGGGLRAVLGTMGGDAQPQVVLQLLARLLHAGQAPGPALAAGRFALASADPADAGDGFATWRAGGRVAVQLEGQAPGGWAGGLALLGHDVRERPAFDSGFGHAQAIVVGDDGVLHAAADPRPRSGGAAGW